MANPEYKQELNKSAGQVIGVACTECKRENKHDVLASVEFDESQDVGYGNTFSVWGSYQVIQCRGCETISFRKSIQNSEDWEHYEDGTVYHPAAIDLFPSRDEGRSQMRNAFLAPKLVHRIYMETLSALNNKMPVLAGIGLRALIETVCKDKKAVGKTLFEKIDKLVQLGVLTPDGAAILHKIRSLGNDAAHEVKPHEQAALELAMDVCEHLLQGVYVLPREAKKTFK